MGDKNYQASLERLNNGKTELSSFDFQPIGNLTICIKAFIFVEVSKYVFIQVSKQMTKNCKCQGFRSQKA